MKKRGVCCFLLIFLFLVIHRGSSIRAAPVMMRLDNEETQSQKQEDFNLTKEMVEKHRKEVEKKSMQVKGQKGVVNILLVGVDSRDSRRKGRSDAMIVLTLDKINKKIKLTSLMRDTYVEIEGHGKEKLNHSFAYGGIDLLRKTIASSFKIRIDNHIVVNFADFEKIIDEIGGVEVYIDENELEIVNAVRKDKLEKTGRQRLDGKSALQYARIRKVGNGSYGRTERDREVMENLKDEIKKIGVLKYPKLVGVIMKSVNTDLNLKNIIDHGYWFFKHQSAEVKKLQMPSTEYSEGELLGSKGWVLKMDEINNVKILWKFIYE